MSAPASSSAGLPEGARVVLATHNAGKVRELRQLSLIHISEPTET